MAKVMKAPGKYIQAAGELKNIGTHVKNMGTKFLVIISKRNQAEHGEEIKTSLEEAGYECVFETFGGECSLEEIDRLMKIGKEAECNSVIAVGGGKAIDTGKAVAVRLDVTVIVVPTIASNDAPCSGLSVVYNDQGVVCKVIYGKRNPDVVLVDTAIIASSPVRLFVSGMGDALSTYFEARACKASGARNYCRGTAPNTAIAMAKLCFDLLMKSGVQAFEDVKKGEATEAVEDIAEAEHPVKRCWIRERRTGLQLTPSTMDSHRFPRHMACSMVKRLLMVPSASLFWRKHLPKSSTRYSTSARPLVFPPNLLTLASPMSSTRRSRLLLQLPA